MNGECKEKVGDILCGLTLVEGEGLHKVTTDTLALAGFILPLKDTATVIELGVGTGALSLLIAAGTLNKTSNNDLCVTGVELHHTAAAIARENIQRNSLTDRVEIIEDDWRSLYGLYPEGAFELVVSNPPYIKKGSGRVSPASHRALARHESAGTLGELVEVAAYLAGRRGRVAFVYPIGRFCELLGELHRRGLLLRRLSFVYTGKQGKTDAAKVPLLFLVEFGREGVLKVEPPVFV